MKILQLIACTLLALTHPVFADSEFDAKVEALLRQEKRPTVSQLLNAFKEWPEENPFPATQPQNLRIRPLLREAPHVIAQMDRAFPNALWVPMGRDAALFGDVIDAVFQSIGEKGRVRRFNASGPSFHGFSDPAELGGIFIELGIDVENLPTDRPVVFVDRTGYNNGSQSQQVMRAGYQWYVSKGGDPRDLYFFLNVLSMQTSHVHGYIQNHPGNTIFHVQDNEDPRAKLIELATRVTDQGPGQILVLQNAMTDSMPWHSGFGNFKKQDEGGLVAPVGSPQPRETRLLVLHELYEVIDAVQKGHVVDLVKIHSQRMGGSFPEAPLSLEELRKNADQYFNQRKETLVQEFRKLLVRRTVVEPFMTGGHYQLDQHMLSQAQSLFSGIGLLPASVFFDVLEILVEARKAERIWFPDFSQIAISLFEYLEDKKLKPSEKHKALLRDPVLARVAVALNPQTNPWRGHSNVQAALRGYNRFIKAFQKVSASCDE